MRNDRRLSIKQNLLYVFPHTCVFLDRIILNAVLSSSLTPAFHREAVLVESFYSWKRPQVKLLIFRHWWVGKI